jgi:hypothetical protein
MSAGRESVPKKKREKDLYGGLPPETWYMEESRLTYHTGGWYEWVSGLTRREAAFVRKGGLLVVHRHHPNRYGRPDGWGHITHGPRGSKFVFVWFAHYPEDFALVPVQPGI